VTTLSACPTLSCSSRAIRLRSTNRAVSVSRRSSRWAYDGPSSAGAARATRAPTTSGDTSATAIAASPAGTRHVSAAVRPSIPQGSTSTSTITAAAPLTMCSRNQAEARSRSSIRRAGPGAPSGKRTPSSDSAATPSTWRIGGTSTVTAIGTATTSTPTSTRATPSRWSSATTIIVASRIDRATANAAPSSRKTSRR
jgi:hypothetical protein